MPLWNSDPVAQRCDHLFDSVRRLESFIHQPYRIVTKRISTRVFAVDATRSSEVIIKNLAHEKTEPRGEVRFVVSFDGNGKQGDLPGPFAELDLFTVASAAAVTAIATVATTLEQTTVTTAFAAVTA